MSTDVRRPGSVSESEHQVRNAKTSESVVAAFQAAGFPSAARSLRDHHHLCHQLHMSHSIRQNLQHGAQLGNYAAMGVNTLLESMPPAQREALRAGVNPLDPAAVLQFSDKLQKLAPQQVASANLSSTRSGDNSARYDQVGEAASRGDWSSPFGQTYIAFLKLASIRLML